MADSLGFRTHLLIGVHTSPTRGATSPLSLGETKESEMKCPMTGHNQGGPWRRGVGTLLLLVPALVMLGVPRVARADANGCTAAPYGMVCIVVEGDGLRVDHAAVVRDKADPAFICKYRGRMTVTDSSGKVIDKRYSSRHKGCTPGRAWFDWYPKKKYPNNSKLCTTFFEDGEEQGTACATIHD